MYSESPMNPLVIDRQRYQAGLAFEKHRWTFPNSLEARPISLFEYAQSNSISPGVAVKEQYKPDISGRPEEATPFLDYLLPGANPQPPLHFTLLYEPSLSSKAEDRNQAVTQSLVWRLLETVENPLYLIFYRRTIPPLDSNPKTTLQLVETILGRPWDEENQPGVVSLFDRDIRQRAFLSLGVKGFSRLYILALPPESALKAQNSITNFSPEILAAIKSLTDIGDYINYPSFYSLVSLCDWVLTTHNLVPGCIPFCFYSPQDIRPRLRELHQQTANEDKRELIEIDELSGLPIQPEQLQTSSFVVESAQLTRSKIANEVYVSDIFPIETITGVKELSLAWTEVTRIDELSEFGCLTHLNLDGTLIWDLMTTLSKMTWLESLSLRQVQLKDLSFLTSLTALKHLSISRMPFKGLASLSNVASLESLSLDKMKLKDLSLIASCKSLKQLSLNKTPLEHIDDISLKLPSIEYLSLDYTQVTDLNPLLSLQGLKQLSLNYSAVEDITPLSFIESLKVFIAEYIGVENWFPLQRLKHLEKLCIPRSTVSDISFLTHISTLQILDLANTEVVDLSPLKALSELRELNLYETRVFDISVLISLNCLCILDLGGTGVQDFSLLSQISSLESLRLNYSQVVDLSWLSDLTQLKELHLAGTLITDISVLNTLLRLENLNLASSNVQDFSPLVTLSNLKSLDLSRSQVIDLSWLAGLKHLEVVNLSHTEVKSISMLTNAKKIRVLDISFTSVTDITYLGYLLQLEELNLQGTRVSDISILKNLKQLKKLELRDTEIEDFSPLLCLLRLQELKINANPINSDVHEILLQRHNLIEDND
jgi:internalin A